MLTRNALLVGLVLGLALSALAPKPALALGPDEILVVANSRSAKSVELARLYVKLRGISPDRLLLVDTATGQDVSRADYERQILYPIARHLVDNNLIETTNCISLIWGMPLKIGPAKLTGEIAEIISTYKTASLRNLYRMQTDLKLLGTVAMEFPKPKTDGLKPIGRLFSPKVTVGTETKPDRSKLQTSITQLVEVKTKAARKLSNQANQAIAFRQLMAIQLDVFGLKGLIEYINKNNPPGSPDINELTNQLNQASLKIEGLNKAENTVRNTLAALEVVATIGGTNIVATVAEQKLKLTEHTDAALDSELAMMWWGDQYPLAGMRPNTLNWQIAAQAIKENVPPLMMTARIDGATAEDARRMIIDSVETEKIGLKGKFYIDAGGKHKAYDKNLRILAQALQEISQMEVVIDHDSTLFQPGTCDDAALYVGWYSLKKYIPAFTWNTGAVGWHIASFEAVNLRDPNSTQWCPKMIQNGVVATVGAVDEPYLGAFPLPQQFFLLLLTGKYTLAECYWRTVPQVSWRMMLIGDPLYNPFAANPQVKVSDLPPQLLP